MESSKKKSLRESRQRAYQWAQENLYKNQRASVGVPKTPPAPPTSVQRLRAHTLPQRSTVHVEHASENLSNARRSLFPPSLERTSDRQRPATNAHQKPSRSSQLHTPQFCRREVFPRQREATSDLSGNARSATEVVESPTQSHRCVAKDGAPSRPAPYCNVHFMPQSQNSPYVTVGKVREKIATPEPPCKRPTRRQLDENRGALDSNDNVSDRPIITGNAVHTPCGHGGVTVTPLKQKEVPNSFSDDRSGIRVGTPILRSSSEAKESSGGLGQCSKKTCGVMYEEMLGDEMPLGGTWAEKVLSIAKVHKVHNRAAILVVLSTNDVNLVLQRVNEVKAFLDGASKSKPSSPLYCEALLSRDQVEKYNLECTPGEIILCRLIYEIQHRNFNADSFLERPPILVTSPLSLLRPKVMCQVKRLHVASGLARFVLDESVGPGVFDCLARVLDEDFGQVPQTIIPSRMSCRAEPLSNGDRFLGQNDGALNIGWELQPQCHPPALSPYVSETSRKANVPDAQENVGLDEGDSNSDLSISVPADISQRLPDLPFLVQYELSRFCSAGPDEPHLNAQEITDDIPGMVEAAHDNFDLCSRIYRAAKGFMTYEKNLRVASTSGFAIDQGLRFRAKLEAKGTGRLSLLSPQVARDGNRVYRKYGSHRFLEVLVPKKVPKVLIRKLCCRPLWIAGRKYTLLRVKMTEKAAQVYIFFAEKGVGISDEVQVSSVEEFCIPLPFNPDISLGKKMKRYELSFSATTPACVLPDGCLTISSDITTPSGVVMTDGCGLVSRQAIDLIWSHYELNRIRDESLSDSSIVADSRGEKDQNRSTSDPCPWTSFQGRIGSFKGEWVLDENLEPGVRVICRPSQKKFTLPMKSYDMIEEECEKIGVTKVKFDPAYDTVEVCEWDRNPAPARLNQRLIQILEFRGVPAERLMDKVKEGTVEIEGMKGSRKRLLEYYRGRAKISDSVSMLDDDLLFRMACSNVPSSEPVFKTLVEEFISSELDTLREKSSYPVNSSRYLRMIPDHYQLLRPDEAFVTVPNHNHLIESTGHILAMRSPSFFAGDLRKFRVVSLREIHKRAMRSDGYFFFQNLNVGLVLSTLGERSPADMMSGGDYDGDKAWVCWEESFVKFVAGGAPAKTNDLHIAKSPEQNQRAVYGDTLERTNQIIDYAYHFRDHSNCLGRLCNALDKVIDTAGFESAEANSIGAKAFLQVDQPYERQDLSRVETLKWCGPPVPHWAISKKCPHRETYKSKKALGQIWDFLCSQGTLESDLCEEPRLNAHIMAVVTSACKKATNDETLKKKIHQMKNEMHRSAKRYNARLMQTIRKYDNQSEPDRQEKSESIAALQAAFRRELIEIKDDSDKYLAAALLYEQTELLSLERCRTPSRGSKPYRFAWTIAQDYLTRIIADAENKKQGIGVAPVVSRDNEQTLFTPNRRRRR